MNYELAKKLKDAGFPQNINLGTRYYDEADLLDDPSLGSLLNTMPLGNQEVEGWLKVPTLEELIEACGKDFRSLRLTLLPSTQWHCTGVEVLKTFHAPTPLEAVANLWLELHGNKNTSTK